MRTVVRLLTILAPVTLLLLLAIHYYQIPDVIKHKLPDSSLFDSIRTSWPNPIQPPHALPLGGAPISIPDLWRDWSSIIYNARPRSPAITLDGSAQNALPDDNDAARRPYRNHVSNAPADLKSLYKSHELFLKELDKINTSPNSFNGSGIVMVGGGEYFGPAIIGIQMLRRTGSTLPVEVFVPNDKEYEPKICEQYLPRLNARCVVLAELLSHAKGPSARLEISHYQLKPLALLLSSFAEVLLLDSDSTPLIDPVKDLLDTEPYKSTGLIIWPDFWSSTESPQFWTIAGLNSFPQNLPATSSEAGQLLINKNTHLKPLLLATYYNVHGPNYYYPLLSQGALGQGDKETFMAAAVVLNHTYHRVQTPVSALGRYDGLSHRGTAMIQHLPFPSSSSNHPPSKPAFIHANTPKMNAAHLIDEGDLLSIENKPLRLLGTLKQQIDLFGYDLEKTIWDLLVQTGCELSDVIREWKGRKRLCERLEEHYSSVFGGRVEG